MDGWLKTLERQVVELAHFERIQGHASYYRDRDEVRDELDAWMTSASCDVHERADRKPISLRHGASLIAVERVARACHERGWV